MDDANVFWCLSPDDGLTRAWLRAEKKTGSPFINYVLHDRSVIVTRRSYTIDRKRLTWVRFPVESVLYCIKIQTLRIERFYSSMVEWTPSIVKLSNFFFALRYPFFVVRRRKMAP